MFSDQYMTTDWRNFLDRCVGLAGLMKGIIWIFLLAATAGGSVDLRARDAPEGWKGRWLPERSAARVSAAHSQSDILDPKHGVKMGISSSDCDDGWTNLTLDWDNSPINYTCFTARFVASPRTKALIEYRNIPKYYSAQHLCMNESISYKEAIPTFGTHRPLWPRYGEYRFLPAPRWVHSLEHGAIVMLYHPCADPAQVDRLRGVLRSCLRRHIVTPSTLLSPQRPLALVAWGVRLTMSWADEDLAASFVRQNALRGPEQVSRDGQFDIGLLVLAETVSDFNDSTLCPTF